MLRALVLALLLANIFYLAWVQNLLGPYGFGPASQAEPERLKQQIRPEAIQLLKASPPELPAPAASSAASAPAPASSAAASPQAAASSATPASGAPAASAPVAAPAPAASAAASAPVAVPAPAPAAADPVKPVAVPALVQIAAPVKTPEIRQCLQAGLFTERQASAMRSRLQAGLPKDSWSFVTTREPLRWIVYTGKYSSQKLMEKKRAQLKQAGLAVETPLSPQLSAGLSLGRYNTQAQAKAAQAKLAKRGIGSTTVVQDRPEQPNRLIRLPAADKALQAQARALILQLSGQRLRSCS